MTDTQPAYALTFSHHTDSTPPPYTSQCGLIRDQLTAVQERVRVAHEALRASDEPHAIDSIADARINARIEASVRSGCELPIMRLRDRFELSGAEERVLWTLIAHELSSSVRQMIRGLATESVSDPTTDAIHQIVYGRDFGLQVWRELGEHGTLRRYGFIDRTDTEPGAPEHRQTWKVSRRVLALAHGDLGIDPEISEIARLGDRPNPRVEDLEVVGDAARLVAEAFERRKLVLVHGRAGSGRRSLLAATAEARKLVVLHVDGRSISKEREVAQRQLRSISRECRLLGLVPLIADLEALDATSETQDRIDLVERELTGLVLATSARSLARRWKHAPTTVELKPLAGAQRATLWSRALPMASTGDADILATMYPLAPAFIEAAGRVAVERCGPCVMKPEHIEAGLRAVLDDRLAGLATRLPITQSWDDLVLPDDQATAITELLSRIRERRRVYEDWGFAEKIGKGLGVAALFSGPPGTGKTMAAGLVARALRIELYQVDLSKVVSKWIGETEKNLAALFDAAEAGHAVLLFDEADALFGKRTDVRSSNDRHANQEVNFLLQRLETFTGICILTTNHETAIDEAFRRRLAVHVRFPMPDADERDRLWHAMIPASAPRTDDLGIDRLARTYVMSGGYIRNAVLRAAFLAADEGGALDATRLSRAAQLEYEALGKIVASRP